MKFSIIAGHAALGFAILVAAAPPAYSQRQWVAVEAVSEIPFMTGGVGKDEQTVMRKAGKNYNLRFEFSERKDSEFIVGTELLITDLQGNTVFSLPFAGPIVNVSLPDGQYRAIVSYQGESQSRPVTLRGRAGQDVYFHWKGKPKASGAIDTGPKAD